MNISEAKLLEIKGKAGNDSNSKYMNDVLTEWIGKKSKKVCYLFSGQSIIMTAEFHYRTINTRQKVTQSLHIIYA